MKVPYVANPSAIGNPDETPVVIIPPEDAGIDSYAAPLVEMLDDLLAELADSIAAADPCCFYRNKIAEARRIIGDWFAGDYV